MEVRKFFQAVVVFCSEEEPLPRWRWRWRGRGRQRRRGPTRRRPDGAMDGVCGRHDHDALCASRLPFLCGRCLLLVDAGYSSRFASQLEAWLSMQLTTADGFVESPAHERCAIRLLRDEPSFMQTLLVESWRGKALKQACEMLATAEGVEEADGHAQLERLRMWDRWLRAQSAIEGTDA